jgi:hypothetical protein
VSAPFPPPAGLDFLEQAIDCVRQYLDRAFPVGVRLRNLWAAVVAARELASSDVIEAEFIRLAYDAGLTQDLGRHSDEHLRHVIRWAMLGHNPFQ